jgi:hypothetical protein
VNIHWLNVAWSGASNQQFNTVTASSARAWCYVDATNFASGFFFDQIYLSLSPGRY